MADEIYSPGLEGVIAGETAISTITGGLLYRGYAVEELAAKVNFESVAYLLLYGELPTAAELEAFASRIAASGTLPQPIVDLIIAAAPTANPMDLLRTATSALAHWDADVDDNSHAANVRKAERLLAQTSLVIAEIHRARHATPWRAPRPELGFAGNLLWMLRGQAPSAEHTKAMDVSLILYAEHEFNASTFTARVVASTLADLHGAIAAAIAALKGPLHGGANERVMDVLREVGSADKAEAWIHDALAKKVRIMGFGHRVYKTGDPRARYLKSFCAELAKETGHDDMEAMADILETIVVREKKLPPNLDWPSARLYHYLGLEVELYTPLFVASRVVGWSAHVIEQLDHNRLIRPRSRYTGAAERAVP